MIEITATVLSLLLASLAHAGPIIARDEAGVDPWASFPVTRFHWKGDYTKCLGVESAEQVDKVVVKDCGPYGEGSGIDVGWKFHPDTSTAIIHAHTQLCLTGGDEVSLKPCNADELGLSEKQLWWYMGPDDLHLSQVDGTTCLDYKEGGQTVDEGLQGYTCFEDNDNQKWIEETGPPPVEASGSA